MSMSRAQAEEAAQRAKAKANSGQPNGTAPTPDLERVIDPVEWQGKPVPPREWTVNGWIVKFRVAALYGDGGTGKSTIAQQLGTCSAIGRNWFGLPTTPGRTLIVSCEDDEDELHRRQEDINRHYGIDYQDLGGRLRLVDRVGRDNLLMAFERGDVGKLQPFFDQLEAECRKFDPDLISLDPAADLFGGNENSRGHARQFIGTCFGQLIRLCPRPATGLLLAHPSTSGMSSGTGTSGSTDWSNAVRSRLYFEKVGADDGEAPDEDARYLWRKKSNHARPGDRILLRYHEGVFEPDQKVTAMDPGFLGSMERTRCECVFLDLLVKCIAERGYVSDSRSSDKYAPSLFIQRPDRGGFKRRDFELAMARLFADGRIRQSTYKTDSRNVRVCIVPATDEEPVTSAADGEPSP